MIRDEHKLVTIKTACDLLGVSRSGYYAWLTRPKKVDVDIFGQKVKRIFDTSRGVYGARRIRKELMREGLVASRRRIAAKMYELELVAKARRKTRATTDSDHKMPVAPNLLDRQFDVPGPNLVWVSDITYLSTTQGWLYLAVVIDLYARKVVGWRISTRMKKELVMDALAWRQSSVNRHLGSSATLTGGASTAAMHIRTC